jgi:hypothetical protein
MSGMIEKYFERWYKLHHKNRTVFGKGELYHAYYCAWNASKQEPKPNKGVGK